jgi:hypothetical protein
MWSQKKAMSAVRGNYESGQLQLAIQLSKKVGHQTSFNSLLNIQTAKNQQKKIKPKSNILMVLQQPMNTQNLRTNKEQSEKQN